MKRALFAVVPLVLAACGGSGSSGTAGYSSPAPAASTPAAAASPASAATVKVGPAGMLTGADGLTLYRFTPEAGTKIACIGTCATTWPPLLMPTGDPVGTGLPAPLGTVMRPDGGRQVTHNGWPLYRFHLDAAPGDAKGQGIAGKWFAATPGDPPA